MAGDPIYHIYAVHLEIIVVRLDAADDFLDDAYRGWPWVRAAAVELRGVLEHLLFSGLITHREHVNRTQEQLRKAKAADAVKAVKAINAEWWPQPVDPAVDPTPGVRMALNPRGEVDWLTEAEWGPMFGMTSDIVHARNPYAPQRYTLQQAADELAALLNKIVRLLTRHTIVLPGGDVILFGQVGPRAVLPRVHVDQFLSAPAPGA